MAEPVIDPDCRDGKHASCFGGPCGCQCHAADQDAGLRCMLIVIGGIVALLAGCETAVEPESQQGTQGSVSTFWATTVDDRRIPCVSWQLGNHAGGLSCDWSLK